jgi:hypothetical protein
VPDACHPCAAANAASFCVAQDRPASTWVCTSSERDGARGCLLIGNLVGNKIGCVGIHQHVLGVSALCLNPCTLQIGTEHSAPTLTPFAPPARGLNPCGTHTVADLSRDDVGRPRQRSPRPARGRGLGGMARASVRAFGVRRCSRCRLHASSRALDLVLAEVAELL